MSDGSLIRDSLRGDPDAFGELVRRHQDRLYNTVLGLMNGHAEDARDVVQETLLNAYQSLGNFRGQAEFSTWLYRIAFNAAVSYRRKRRAVVSLEAAGPTPVEPPDLSRDCLPGTGLERAEDEVRVRGALARLSPDYRAVLVLKDVDDRKYEDIAEVLGVPIGTVRSRLHRARLELRNLLRDAEAGG